MPRFAILTTIFATIAVSGIPAAATSATTSTAAPAAVAAAGCDTGAVGFTPVLQLNLPTSANWLNQTPPYSLNNTAAIGSNFDRVGY